MRELEPLLFFAGLFVFVIFFYTYWQNLCIDWARQLMFEERGKLLRLVLEGSFSFESPQYRSIRRLIEINIRFLHELTWPRIIYLELFKSQYMSDEADKSSDDFFRLISSIQNPSLRKEVKAICVRVGFAGLVCLMGRSIFLGPIFLVLYIFGLLRDTTTTQPTGTVYSTVTRNAFPFEDAHFAYQRSNVR